MRRAFRKVLAGTSLDAAQWTPRELRHSFVSLLDDANVPIEKISRLVGHAGTTDHRDCLPVPDPACDPRRRTAMDEIFPAGEDDEPGPAE